jgi:hypothetical protein
MGGVGGRSDIKKGGLREGKKLGSSMQKMTVKN